MKSPYFMPIILFSLLIAARTHYFEYQSNQPKLIHCFSQNTPCFNDYEAGLRAAKLWEKPAILMFSGWACVYCQRWVEALYKHPSVLEFMEDEFVFIVLNVDDQTPLPKPIDYIRRNKKKEILKTTGDKWSSLQIDCYSGNQPKFFLLNSEKELLVIQAFNYHPNIEKFAAFLEAGLQNFQHGISEGKMECGF
ncbi:MAG: thioredoxin family protein [Chitinophagales bacterium]